MVLDVPGTIVHAECVSELLNETLKLAKATSLPSAELCRRAKVGIRWYHDLLAGRFKDPGINKIERLNLELKKVQPNKSRRA